jgi:hypothetical protein
VRLERNVCDSHIYNALSCTRFSVEVKTSVALTTAARGVAGAFVWASELIRLSYRLLFPPHSEPHTTNDGVFISTMSRALWSAPELLAEEELLATQLSSALAFAEVGRADASRRHVAH